MIYEMPRRSNERLVLAYEFTGSSWCFYTVCWEVWNPETFNWFVRPLDPLINKVNDRWDKTRKQYGFSEARLSTSGRTVYGHATIAFKKAEGQDRTGEALLQLYLTKMAQILHS